MLTDESYTLALWVWGLSGGLAVLYWGWFLRRRCAPFWWVFLVLSAAVVLLFPAPASTEATTWAPAVLVAVFGAATGAMESVVALWQRLGIGIAAAFTIALCLQLLWFRRRNRSEAVSASS